MRWTYHIQALLASRAANGALNHSVLTLSIFVSCWYRPETLQLEII